MKLEITNGKYVGTAEWQRPGVVVLDMEDPAQETWFEDYFHGEDAYLDGSVECSHMSSSRRDASEEAFAHAGFRLAAYNYRVQMSEEARRDDAPGARTP
ncbi:MAG TPA: hypothetical protein VNC78_02700 [Actinomycetota bacterium]|nr:hypothetical protein [Actinomycetota bacterium]